MFRFLLGVAFGAAGYWAWQSFGRDLLGLGSDQDTYGGYSSSTSFGSSSSTGSSFGSSGSTGATSIGGSTSTPSTAPSSSSDTPNSGAS